MRLMSFNVNGVRACAGKTLVADLERLQMDAVCLQETKATPAQVSEALAELRGYEVHAYDAEQKGYSGTATLCARPPLSVQRGIGVAAHDAEGRVLTTEWEQFFLVNVYVPNSSSGLSRLPYRTQEWDVAFLSFLKGLEARKPVVVCGDLNVSHRPIDLANARANYNVTPGYTQAEIDGFERLLAAGFVDTFRALHPEEVRYSWWSYRAGARERNIGWRLDYFLVSSSLLPAVRRAEILNDVYGSDHCPVALDVDLR
ncbi:MAG: exodeoxyribonuclease III [Deltaproteobacteria bacterium]|nr:exodeoxyribonuclease III [Deltaproteobacteria bacterium]